MNKHQPHTPCFYFKQKQSSLVIKTKEKINHNSPDPLFVHKNNKRKTRVPATKITTIKNSLPSKPHITNGCGGGGWGAGAGQLASQSTQEHAGSLSYLK